MAKKLDVQTDPPVPPVKPDPKIDPEIGDDEVQELFDKITGRLDTLDTEILKDREGLADQKKDLLTIRDFITTNKTLTMADLIAKAKKDDLPTQITPPTRARNAFMNFLLPDLWGSLKDLFNGPQKGK